MNVYLNGREIELIIWGLEGNPQKVDPEVESLIDKLKSKYETEQKW